MTSQQQPTQQQQQHQQYRRRSFNSMYLLITISAAVLTTATAFVPSTGLSTATKTISTTSTLNNRGIFPLFASSVDVDAGGMIKTITKPGTGKSANLGDIATIKYSCYLPDDEKAIPFARSEKQKMVRLG